MAKPPCSWQSRYIDGTVSPTCRLHAAKTWPVCRNHLRSWLLEKPTRAVDFAQIEMARRKGGQAWMQERGLDPTREWYEVTLVPDDAKGRFRMVLDGDGMAIIADYCEATGREEAAKTIRYALGRTAALPGLFG